jgi:hypothetical protein
MLNYNPRKPLEVHFDTHTKGEPYSWVSYGVTRTADRYTVDVTLFGVRKTVECSGVNTPLVATMSPYIYIHGFAVMFPTGEKVWEGGCYFYPEKGTMSAITPRIDSRSARNCRVIGFFADYEGKAVESKHNGA